MAKGNNRIESLREKARKLGFCVADDGNGSYGLVKDALLTDAGLADVLSELDAKGRLENYRSLANELTAEQAIEKLKGYLWDVNPDPQDPDSFITSKTWTLKGLRYHLAREQFLESVLHPPEDAGEPAQEATPLEQRVSRQARILAHQVNGQGVPPEDQVTVLYSADGENLTDLVSGVHGIAEVLNGPMFEDLGDDTLCRLVQALVNLTNKLYDATYNLPSELDHRIQRALAEPDTEAEALVKRLHGTGYRLYIDADNNCYALADHHGNMPMSTVSIAEIESWMKLEGIGGEA